MNTNDYAVPQAATPAAATILLTTITDGGTVGGQPIRAIVFPQVPSDEAWLWQHPELLREVLTGIEQSRNGDTAEASFVEFIDADDE